MKLNKRKSRVKKLNLAVPYRDFWLVSLGEKATLVDRYDYDKIKKEVV